MRVCVTMFSVLILAGGAWAAEDTLIIPGKSVGRITKVTTVEELQRLFGKKNVTMEELPLGEGETAKGAVVYGTNPRRKLQVAWNDAEGTSGVQWVRILGKSSDWHTSEGITLGTTLAELEKMNGRPFRLYGFAWDYGGTVAGWQGGKLERALKDVRLVLDPGDVSGESYRKVMGDREYASDNPHMRKLNPRVNQITVMFD